MKKILIIEDELIIASDIQGVLEAEGYFVVGIADCYEKAIKIFEKKKPNIIISDIYLKGNISGIEIVKIFLEQRPVSVIFITAYSNNEIIETLADFNSISYITKPFTNTQLLAAVKMASSRLQKTKTPTKLTHREQEILNKIMQGYSSAKIATELKISMETVKTHRRNIFAKYQVNSITKLINCVLKNSSFSSF